MLESSPERGSFPRHRKQQYVGRDAVAALHQLLRVRHTQSLDLQVGEGCACGTCAPIRFRRRNQSTVGEGCAGQGPARDTCLGMPLLCYTNKPAS